jgi:hypothetical protein
VAEDTRAAGDVAAVYDRLATVPDAVAAARSLAAACDLGGAVGGTAHPALAVARDLAGIAVRAGAARASAIDSGLVAVGESVVALGRKADTFDATHLALTIARCAAGCARAAARAQPSAAIGQDLVAVEFSVGARGLRATPGGLCAEETGNAILRAATTLAFFAAGAAGATTVAIGLVLIGGVVRARRRIASGWRGRRLDLHGGSALRVRTALCWTRLRRARFCCTRVRSAYIRRVCTGAERLILPAVLDFCALVFRQR